MELEGSLSLITLLYESVCKVDVGVGEGVEVTAVVEAEALASTVGEHVDAGLHELAAHGGEVLGRHRMVHALHVLLDRLHRAGASRHMAGEDSHPSQSLGIEAPVGPRAADAAGTVHP